MLTTMLTSCLSDKENKDEVLWDIMPINYYVFISDEPGQDLLDSTFANHLLKEITVTYVGNTYTPRTMQQVADSIQNTRAYLPHFYGLYINCLVSL